jgi:hypothetical protein
MKKLIAVLTLTFALSLVSHAANYTYTGVWYDTVSVLPKYKQAGQMDIVFDDNSTFNVWIYYGGELVATANGSWYLKRISGITYTYFKFYDSDGWSYSGRIRSNSQFLSGTFANPSRTVRGSFQMNNIHAFD